jgi:hypothetical protein
MPRCALRIPQRTKKINQTALRNPQNIQQVANAKNPPLHPVQFFDIFRNLSPGGLPTAVFRPRLGAVGKARQSAKAGKPTKTGGCMDTKTLLTFSPVGVRRLRKVSQSLDVKDGLIIRTTNTVDVEVPSGVWDVLLQDNAFAHTWTSLRDSRATRQAEKKALEIQSKKDNLLSAVDLLKTAGVLNV